MTRPVTSVSLAPSMAPDMQGLNQDLEWIEIVHRDGHLLSLPVYSMASPLILLPTPVLFVAGSAPSSILTLRIRGPSSADTEPVEVQSVCDHILLGLEQDDVHLGCKQTAQDHKAA